MKNSRIRIFLIESQVAHQPRGGVARYTRQMVRGLYNRYGDRFVVCSRLDELPDSLRRVRLPLRYPWRYASQLFDFMQSQAENRALEY
jgi:hypothetical protein